MSDLNNVSPVEELRQEAEPDVFSIAIDPFDVTKIIKERLAQENLKQQVRIDLIDFLEAIIVDSEDFS